jgi:hopanoid biosynthesis associated protein HpnK
MAKEVNEAVEKAHRDGVLSAASLMVAGPAAGHAIALAKRMPSLRVGLHLVLADGHAVLPADVVPTLVGEDGRFRAGMVRAAFRLSLRPAVRRQMAKEIAAQFTAFRQTGLTLDHVDAHEHFHVHPVVAGMVIAVGRRNGMAALRTPSEPVQVLSGVERVRSSGSVRLMAPWVARLRRQARAAGVLTPDAVFGLRWSGAMTAERMEGLLARLPPGLVEIYFHPATAERFDGHAPGYRYRDELKALTDAGVIERVRTCGRRIGGYGDFSA